MADSKFSQQDREPNCKTPEPDRIAELERELEKITQVKNDLEEVVSQKSNIIDQLSLEVDMLRQTTEDILNQKSIEIEHLSDAKRDIEDALVDTEVRENITGVITSEVLHKDDILITNLRMENERLIALLEAKQDMTNKINETASATTQEVYDKLISFEYQFRSITTMLNEIKDTLRSRSPDRIEGEVEGQK